MSQDLWSLILKGYTKLDATIFSILTINNNKELLENRKKDVKGLFTIQSGISVYLPQYFIMKIVKGSMRDY